VAVIGSSLGGALAVLAAARYPSIQRAVLLAPAVMFAKPGHHLLPPDRIDEWRRRGAMPFFHYAHGQERLLNFSFYEDTLRYDPFETVFTQPALIYQGRADTSVDPQTVGSFARPRPNVTLTLLDDDYQLTASLPAMWSGIQSFGLRLRDTNARGFTRNAGFGPRERAAASRCTG
jgi:pimeloyl-ACP methyl ester carboxylesterase